MANILNATEDYNPKNGLKNIFTKLIEIIKALNANTNAIAAMGNPKVYKALLTQSGTDAPVATVLVNTLSGTPVWSYSGEGAYLLTLTGEFVTTKTIVTIGQTNNNGGGGSGTFVQYNSTNQSDNYVVLNSYDVDLVAQTVTASNDIITILPITIEVYP